MKTKDSKVNIKLQSTSGDKSPGTAGRAATSGGSSDREGVQDQRAASEAGSGGSATPVDSHLHINWEKEEGDEKDEGDASVPSRTASSLLFDDNLLPPETPNIGVGRRETENPRLMYQKACEDFGVVPCRKYLRDLHCGRAVVASQGLGHWGIKAICAPLAINMTLKELYLPGNRMGPRGMRHLADMLVTNRVLRVLDVSNNDLGRVGANILGGIIETNDTLHSIRAASNNFDNTAAQFIGEALRHTTTLKDLDISENLFEENAGVFLGEGLAANHSLEALDASYNHIRRKGIAAFALALQGETILKCLNLAWNGVGDIGAKQLAAGLAENDHLVTLDLTGCRIVMAGVIGFFNHLGSNTALKSIDVSHNPLTSADAIVLLKEVKAKPGCGIDNIQISNIMVSKEFLEELDDLKKARPRFTVIYRDVLGLETNRSAHTGIQLECGDPLEIVFKYVRAKKFRLIDLFSRLDVDKSNSLTRQELVRGLQNAGIMLSIAQMDKLLMKLDRNGDGEVDFGELIAAHKLHKRKMRQKKINVYQEGDFEEDDLFG